MKFPHIQFHKRLNYLKLVLDGICSFYAFFTPIVMVYIKVKRKFQKI